MELEVILKLWPIFLAIIIVVIWNIRLESKVLYLEKDHAREVKSSADVGKISINKL